MNRLRELDLLRVCGTIIIVLHHLPDYTGNFYDLRYFGLHGNLSYVNVVNTYIGLGIFTFVSGMALSHAYPRVERVGNFLWKRWLRLFPLYWLTLPMFALTGIRSDTWGTAIHIPGLQIALAPRLVRPLPTLWFVGLVALLYPFYAFIARRKQTTREIALMSLATFVIAFLIRITLNIVEYRFFVYFPVFVAGVLWRRSEMYRRHRLRPIPAMLAVILFVLSVFAFRYVRQSDISGEVGEDFIAQATWSDIVSTFVFSSLMMFSFLYLAYPLARAVAGRPQRPLPTAGIPPAVKPVAGPFTNIHEYTNGRLVFVVHNSCVRVPFVNGRRMVAQEHALQGRHSYVGGDKGWRRAVNLISWASYGIYLFHRPVLAVLTTTINASTIARPWRLAAIALPGIALSVTLACAAQYIHDRLTSRLLARGKR